MGLTMAPATDSVMGSLPSVKAGVGSAVNDTTRQVGGAMGVAVVGSVLATTYGDKIGNALAANGITGPLADAAKNSIGAIPQVAPRNSRAIANQAFVDAVHWGVAVAALATAIGVGVALVFLPARARAEDREEQAAEYAEEHTDEFQVPDEPSPVAPSDGDRRVGSPGSVAPEPAPEH